MDSTTEKKEKMSKTTKQYIHTVIGIAIMLIFWCIPGYDVITPLGMKCLGAFLGMIYLWSTVGALWPSLLGIIMLGLSGIGGEGPKGFESVFISTFGNKTVILLMINMILFGALDVMGCTQYITRWCLTRKIINGRPYMFLSAVFFTSYVISTIVSPPTAVLIVWPITFRMMETFKVTKNDKIWHYFFVGLFCVMCLGQPFFPFKGAQLIIVDAIEGFAGTKISWIAWMGYNFIMTFIITAIYIFAIKFIFKPDVSKLKSVTVDQIGESMKLPKISLPQVLFLLSIPVYVILLLVPNFFSGVDNVILKFFNLLGSIGLSALFCVIFCAIRYQDKPILNFKEVSAKCFNWGTIFMVAAAIYGAGTLSNDTTGVKEFIIKSLNPILGGQSEIMFVIILFVLALLLTNIGNNAGMGLILIPIAGAFCQQLGYPIVPVCVGIGTLVFASILTPAASPHAAMMFGKTDIYTGKSIIKIGLLFCVISFVLFVAVGYPLAKAMF